MERPAREEPQAEEGELQGINLGNYARRTAKQTGRAGSAGKDERPIRLEKADCSPTEETEVPRAQDPRQEGNVCSVTPLRSWVKAQKVERVYMIKLDRHPSDQQRGQDSGPGLRRLATSYDRRARR